MNNEHSLDSRGRLIISSFEEAMNMWSILGGSENMCPPGHGMTRLLKQIDTNEWSLIENTYDQLNKPGPLLSQCAHIKSTFHEMGRRYGHMIAPSQFLLGRIDPANPNSKIECTVVFSTRKLFSSISSDCKLTSRLFFP